MVNFATTASFVLGFVASVSAAPSLEARAVTCREDFGSRAFAHADDAVWCINYLAAKGDTPCVSGISGVTFCARGDVVVTGISKTGKNGATSSCANVARGAGVIMDRCTTSAGGVNFVKGANEAWGNGDLIVDIRSNKGI